MTTAVEQLIEQAKALSPAERQQVRAAISEPSLEKTPELSAEEELQRRLVRSGLLTSPKQPKRDQAAFDRFVPVPIVGPPLSETILQERR